MIYLSVFHFFLSLQQRDAWFAKDEPSFLVDYTGAAKLTFFSWHVVVVYLLLVIILAQVIYHNNPNRLYRYYQGYAAFLLVFVLTRQSYWIGFVEKFGVTPIYTIGYLIQICYLSIYFRFGLLFLRLDRHAPVFTRRMFVYTAAISLFSVGFYGLMFADVIPYSYGAIFFYYIFLPVHVPLAGLIIYRSFQSPEAHMRYFLWGSLFYIVFALISTFAVFYRIPFAWIGLLPIVYFFIAIVIECTLFAVGLGKQIKDNMQEKQELRNLLRETEHVMEIKILRGQLNSHFIFNVLNSIKAFIVEREVDEATEYLGKFSAFIRRILDGSSQESQSLREELETVLLYADIENIRLSGGLNITCDIDNQVDTGAIILPAMVLQPFVENAIWHGLSKSERSDKTLALKVIRRGDEVRVIIEDNGVGYTRAKTLKTRVFRKSYGLQIVRQQLTRFNTNHDFELDFVIGDREGSGTRVVFTIARKSRESLYL